MKSFFQKIIERKIDWKLYLLFQSTLKEIHHVLSIGYDHISMVNVTEIDLEMLVSHVSVHHVLQTAVICRCRHRSPHSKSSPNWFTSTVPVE